MTRKLRLISKFMTSSTLKQIVTIHIVQYLKKKRQSSNKLWLVKEIVFLKNHTPTVVEKLVPDRFLKIQN